MKFKTKVDDRWITFDTLWELKNWFYIISLIAMGIFSIWGWVLIIKTFLI